MSASADARSSALDHVLDDGEATAAIGQDLFGIVDVLETSPTLRRAVIDNSTTDEARSGLLNQLFGGKVAPLSLQVVTEATKLAWPTSGALVAAIEREGVRAVMSEAQRAGRLDSLEDELFMVGRLVDGDRALRAQLSDRRVELPARQDLLGGLITGKVSNDTVVLARRAVAARQRTFEATLQGYLVLAAALRNRGVATVEVAVPLTDEQSSRLRAALARQIGRDVTLNVIVNPAVMGGVRVTLGDEVIEGTVAGRLEDARRKLS